MTKAALAALPSFAVALNHLIEESKGKLAVVTASSGYSVQVQLAGEDTGGFEWIATSRPSITPGSYGVIIPLRGKQSFFIPASEQVEVVPFVDSYGGVANSTTGLATYIEMMAITQTLSAGTWTIAGTWQAMLRRSVDSGSIRLYTAINGETPAPWSFVSGQATPLLEYRNLVRSRTAEIILTAPTNVTLSLGFSGVSTPGTTYCILPGIDAWAIKKG